jgi:transcriptional regulator with XRE-family HTH domain
MASPSEIHPFDRHIGRQVRRLRRARGLTQKGLAEHLEISFQQVQKYETGANRISGSVLVKIARALDAPIVSLFDGLPDPQGERHGKANSGWRHAALSPVERDELLADLERMPAKMRRRLVILARALAALEAAGPVRVRPRDDDVQGRAIPG